MYIRYRDLRNRKRSQRECAEWYGVARSTVDRRLHGIPSFEVANANIQRLTPGEEEALVEWCQQLED